ncbi:type IV secretory system conjugative DNA transfer family protein [Jiangella alkaliphila]|uniref:TraM recognition site of TraD and TraG n=1 Tax=Jiangella alkaliphila TaxID=419479 RepID=A0A1H2L9T1_9ACTN|nr:TraM recognition domain-containing protein [Jiangella alkaliphila]SDU77216.1 TraM recognition site of TraD and TraG [Jiangella alkaliphila]
MTPPRGDRAGTDTLTNLALAVLAGLAVIVLVLRATGNLTALLTGAPQPTAGPGDVVGVLTDPADPGRALGTPGLNPVVYWALTGAVLTGLAVAAWWLRRWTTNQHQRARADPRRLAGTATRAEVARHASAEALTRRGATLRPSLQQPRPGDLGYQLGRAHGRPVWASVEDSILLIGPPRSGKGLHLVINAILDAPGAVVTTSTRPDNITVTLRARERFGPVAVFDPQQLAPGLPAGLRWSPVRGCDDPLTAMIRATGLAAATGLGGGGVDNGGFWEAKTRTALQALLHAAALDHRSPADLFRWTLDPSAASDAVAVLHAHSGAATGWADSLDAMIAADPRTRDSIWQGVSLALSALADPRVLDAVTPRPGEHFDPATFLSQRGTVYLLATGAGAGASSALVAAFVEDLVETARRLAARSPGARLDPPLLLALDEIGNLAPLPSLPVLMAEGGGSGITTLPVLQSMAQARTKWGDNAAGAIWDAAIVKLILGGASNSRDLQDLAVLIGDRDEYTGSTTIDAHGGRSNQQSIRRVPILPPDQLRTLPFGTGITILRTAPPIITDLRAWTARRDGQRLAADQAAVEAALRDGGTNRLPPQ